MMEISDVRLSTVLYIYSERDGLELDPAYQRLSDIWTLEKKQLLIDSIINGYDIPKFYFHRFIPPERISGQTKQYAIIDGKQRLEAIWQFIDGKFPLSDDFEYIIDSKIKPANLTYAELGRKFPTLKLRFDSYDLSIVAVQTKDVELIEDMFSRLNEAVPLSAAEKRNALGGKMPPAIRSLARNGFFTKRLPFRNSRYRHLDLACKFLLIEHKDTVTDTKKFYLDQFVKDWRKKAKSKPTKLLNKIRANLDAMNTVFSERDPFLSSVGNVVLYYHAFRLARDDGWMAEISRNVIIKFDTTRRENRRLAEEDMAAANYDLLEFDRYSQTPNDAYAMQLRLRVFLDHAFKQTLGNE